MRFLRKLQGDIDLTEAGRAEAGDRPATGEGLLGRLLGRLGVEPQIVVHKTEHEVHLRMDGAGLPVDAEPRVRHEDGWMIGEIDVPGLRADSIEVSEDADGVRVHADGADGTVSLDVDVSPLPSEDDIRVEARGDVLVVSIRLA